MRYPALKGLLFSLWVLWDALALSAVAAETRPNETVSPGASSAAPTVNLTEAEQAWLKEHPIVHWGVDPHWPPFSYINPAGKFSGIDMELVKLVADRTGLNIVWVETSSWTETLAKVEAHEIDFTSSTAYDVSRTDLFNFTSPYSSFPVAIITRTDQPFMVSLEKLSGKKIATPRKHITTEHLQRDFPDAVYLLTDTSEEAMLKVTSGEADAMVGNIAVVSHLAYMRGMGNLKISGVVHYEFPLRIAVRRDWPELVSILDKGIASITPKEKGVIYAKYLHPQIIPATGWGKWRRRALYTMSAGAFAVSLVLLWNRRMACEIQKRKKVEEELSESRNHLEHQVEKRTTELKQTNVSLSAEIGERHKIEEALRKSEEKFSKAFHLSPDCIVITRLRDGLILEVNEGFTTLLGHTAREAIGKTSVELGIWADPKEREIWVAEIKAGREIDCREGLFRRRDGSLLFGLVSLRTIELFGETCMLTVGRDITARKQQEEKIMQLNQELEERVELRTNELRGRIAEVEKLNERLELANKELESFSYSISHDLRSPLRRMISFTELLRDEHDAVLNREAVHCLCVIESESRRMEQMIDTLLGFARVGRVEMKRISVHMAEIVSEVMENVQHEIRGRQIEWETGLLPTVFGDPKLISHVVTNLISNAVKFTRGKSPARIEINAMPFKETDDEVVFYVRDNGVGFNMSHASQLFGVFQRLHSPQEFEGTGVGLAGAQRIIQRHGGRIWAEAAVNEGATFYFSLPRKM